jgi:hypothetical protein
VNSSVDDLIVQLLHGLRTLLNQLARCFLEVLVRYIQPIHNAIWVQQGLFGLLVNELIRYVQQLPEVV